MEESLREGSGHLMRCYFMRDGHVAAVEELTEGISDAAAIDAAKRAFDNQTKDKFEGFEVWDLARVVYKSSNAEARRA